MATPSRWNERESDLVVICGNTAWDQNPLGAKNLALALQSHAPILYVDPPLSYATAMQQPELRASLAEPRLRIITPRIARLTPVVAPGKDRPGISWLTDALTRRALRRAASALGSKVRAIVEIAPNHHFASAFPDADAVFWVQDDYTADPALTGVSPHLLSAGVKRHAQTASVVVTASPFLQEQWSVLHEQTVMIPNGCDIDDFARALDDDGMNSKGSRSAVVLSRFSPRIELAVLEEVARRNLPLVLIGAHEPGFADDRWARLVAQPSVQWLGAVPFARVPDQLRSAGVGLIPYTNSAFNRASFPLKALEYLAAGLPVVSSDLPFLDWLACDEVERASAPASFADAVEHALAKPADAAARERRHAFAHAHSWPVRAADWARALQLVPPGAAGPPPALDPRDRPAGTVTPLGTGRGPCFTTAGPTKPDS